MAAPEKAAPLVEGVLARGRSLRTVNGMVSWQEGRPNTVRVPADEVERLRALGYLVDPAKKDEPLRGNGPTFEAKAGPSVRVA